MGTSVDIDYNPYRSKAFQLENGLLYKLDKFCTRCQSVDWHGATRRLQTQRKSSQPVPLFKKPGKLRNQRASCEFCRTIYHALMTHPELREYDDHKRKCQNESSCRDIHHILGDEAVLVGLCDLDGDYNVEVKISSRAYRNATSYLTRKLPTFKQTKCIYARSPENITIARNWLKGCTQKHLSCRGKAEVPILPTRVIDVQSTSPTGRPQPRLVIANNKRGQYAALSYVWGEGAHVSTSEANLEDLCRSITMDSLPQLFQDAILTTRRLGIPYLWIDAVCILQDVPEDVQRELSQMSDIYYNSTLTLAAVGQRSVHTRLMRQQNPHFTKIGGISSVHDGGSDYFVTFLPFGHPAGLTYPLHTRAWCLQETLLSHRVLVLGLREMFWFCRSCQRRASEWQVEKQRSGTDYEAEIFGPLTDEWILHPNLPKRPYTFWYHTVAKYSSRNRSVPSDKLPAISALANMMTRLYFPSKTADSDPNIYLAGLWRDDLLHGLLWRGHTRSSNSAGTRLHGIPSWSWAGWDIEVTAWRRHVPLTPEEEDNFTPLATIIHCSTQLASPDAPFGHVVDGKLMLRGDVAALPHRKHYNTNSSWFRDNSGSIDKYCECPKPNTEYESSRSCGWCYSGKYINAPEYIDKCCVLMKMTRKEALILAPVPDSRPPAFLRVGLLVTHSKFREDLEWRPDIELTVV